MSKLSATMIIIAIILGLGLLVTGIIVVAQKGGKQSQIDPSNALSLYMATEDYKSNEIIDANYIMNERKEETQVRFSGGTLQEGSWTEIKDVPKESIFDIYSWNDDYYSQHIIKKFTQIEKLNNASKVILDMKKIGGLDIKQIGKLGLGTNRIRLNITAKEGSYNKIGAVLSWSPGILDVNLEQEQIFCNNGFWLNYSSFDPLTGEHIYLPENIYKCGEYYESCKSVLGVNCNTFNPKMPTRFVGIVDKTIYLGHELKDGETLSFVLVIRTLDTANVLDYVRITFFDNDMRWDEYTQSWKAFSEYNGKDIAGKDYTHEINYKR